MEKNVQFYNKQFDKVKKLLPKQFMEVYLSNGCFHDCYIMGIEIIRAKSESMPFVDFKISIFDGEKKYEIYYTSVSTLCINGSFISEALDWISWKNGVIDSWGYDEFDISENNLLVHEILFLSGTTVKIECSNISIKLI